MNKEELPDYIAWKGRPETRRFIALTLLLNPRSTTSSDATAIIKGAGVQEGWENGLRKLMSLDAAHADKPEVEEAMRDLSPLVPADLGIAFDS